MPYQNHSLPSSKYIILSAMRGKYKLLDQHNHNQLIAILIRNGINFKQVKGCYNGALEDSVIVNYEHLDLAINLGLRFFQESILILGETEAHGVREASLVYMDDLRCEHIGYLREVDKATALKQDHTYCPIMSKYWIVQESSDVIQPKVWSN